MTIEIINENGKWYSYDRDTDRRCRISKKDAQNAIKNYGLEKTYEIENVCEIYAKW